MYFYDDHRRGPDKSGREERLRGKRRHPTSHQAVSENELKALDELLRMSAERVTGVRVLGDMYPVSHGATASARRLAELEDGRVVFLKLDPLGSRHEAEAYRFLKTTPFAAAMPAFYGHLSQLCVLVVEGFKGAQTLYDLMADPGPEAVVETFTA